MDTGMARDKFEDATDIIPLATSQQLEEEGDQ